MILNLDIPEKKKTRKPPYRKPRAVKTLEAMADEAARKRYPNNPHLAPRKYRDDTANKLTKCIVDYITFCGGFASRVSTTGQYRNDIKKWIPGTVKKGMPDVTGTLKGRSLFIEVKIGRDKMSEDQKKVKRQIENSGGLYFIAKNFTDFKEWLDKI